MPVAIPSDSSIRRKEREKQEKYMGLNEELGTILKMKTKVVPVVTGAIKPVTSPQTGRTVGAPKLAPTDLRNNNFDFCPEKCSAVNNYDTEQTPQPPKSLVGD